jgi:hypothetical protein
MNRYMLLNIWVLNKNCYHLCNISEQTTITSLFLEHSDKYKGKSIIITKCNCVCVYAVSTIALRSTAIIMYRFDDAK